jgi:hypothetical protein
MSISERSIDEMKSRLKGVMDNFVIEDFKRLHTKLIDIILILEFGFEARFPKEAKEFLDNFYKENE